VSTEALDTVVAAETPEGITIELRPAGLAARSLAFLIDQMIRFGLMYGALIVVALMGGVGVAFWIVFAFALEWFYAIPFELSRWGATPGKRALGLKVVMESGLPVTPAASLTRNLLRVADFMPLLYGFGMLSMLMRRDFKRLGDIAAGTLVVYQPQRANPPALSNVEPLAPARRLSARDQAAVIALAARASRLTSDRLDELAALAASVSGDAGKSGPEVTRRVLAVSQWLLGRRQ
jgi:uncharacterized RDD family membrane protein YckC